MFKIKNFDYDLWTTDDGKRFARVRRTGEVCEVDEETMKLLRSLEKKAYRELELKKNLDSDNLTEKTKAAILHPLSIDVTDSEDEEESLWLQSQDNMEDGYIAKEMEKQFISLLTDFQKDVFISVMLESEKLTHFAEKRNTTYQNVQFSIEAIRKKAKKFFESTLYFDEKMSVGK